jgi:hypothetical protein
MTRHDHARAVRRGIALLLVAAACGKDASQTDGQANDAGAGTAASPPSTDASPATQSEAPAELTAANLDAFERGFRKEIELVQAAQERARSATTPEARGEAMQAQWEDQTIPGGAEAAGLAPDAYRNVRRTVKEVLQTLDFQGKIEGPMQMDTTRASPETKKMLASDPLAVLSPSSRTALQERIPGLVPIWVQYVNLTAVGG